MPVHAGGEAFRNARDGGRADVFALLCAWCKPVQLFSAIFASSREEVAAAQPRLWRVVQHGLPAFPDVALPEPWLYGLLASEMELIIAADAPHACALRTRLAEQGARALRHDPLAVCTIGAGLARRVATLDGQGHELLSRRYGGRPFPATRDAAMRLLELRAALDWQSHDARPACDCDPRFAQLLEDALGGGGDAGARPRLHAALVGDPRLGPVFDRQARLDLVLGAWFAPAGPQECEALIRELDWGGDDSSRLSPAVIQARRQVAGSILELAPAPPRPPAPVHREPAPPRAHARGRPRRPAASRIAVLIASGCILLGLLGALMLYLGRPAP
jgi:hypothetical protein